MRYQQQFGSAFPLTPIVKKLLIVNIAAWVVLVMIVQNFFMNENRIYHWFGLVPSKLITSFWLWQPFTYMFLHSENVFHILFNMLILWTLGSELENLWGRKFFLFYYIACGVGAAFLYITGITIYYLWTGHYQPLQMPVVGASGSVFGLLLAYGLLFGERTMLFMMMFPMKARHFVLILGAIEVFTLMGQGVSSETANLAHLGGLVTGYIIIKLFPRIKDYLVRRRTETHGRRLKLVVDNDDRKSPKYWN